MAEMHDADWREMGGSNDKTIVLRCRQCGTRWTCPRKIYDEGRQVPPDRHYG